MSRLRSWPRMRRLSLGVSGVFLAALALFALGASQRDLWRTDEHRYVEVAREMAAEGGSWLVPHLNGAVYAHKPPGFFWVAAALHELGMDLAAAGMAPSVLGGALAVALAFALGRRLYGTRAGLAAAVVLASSEMFLGLALRANLDALLTACTTASLYAYWRAEETRPMGLGADARWVAAAGLFAGLGVLVKGPVAVAVPGVVIASHLALTRGPRAVAQAAWLPALAIAALLALAWLAAASAEAGLGYARELVVGHGLAHPLGGVDKQRPVWFYLKDFPSGFLPWVALLPAAFLALGRPPWSRADALVLAWCVAPFLLFSALPAKRHLYLLPLYPGLALLVGRLLASWSRSARSGTRALRHAEAIGRELLAATSVALGVVLAAAAALSLAGFDALLARLWTPWASLEAIDHVPRVVALLAAPLLAVAGARLVRSHHLERTWRAALALGVATALLLAGVFHPLESVGHDVRPFYRDVATLVGDDLLVVQAGLDFAPNWLLGREVVPSVPTQSFAYWASRPTAREGAWLIAEDDDEQPLRLPDSLHEVLRRSAPLGPALVLVRARDPGALARRLLGGDPPS